MSYKVYNINQKQTYNMSDRIISALSYITFGVVGFIWLLFCAINKNILSDFLKYHIMQSIFFSLFLYILDFTGSFLSDLILKIPYINYFFKELLEFLFQPIYFGFSIITGIVFLIITYLALFALLGRYSYIPFVSDVIRANLGR